MSDPVHCTCLGQNPDHEGHRSDCPVGARIEELWEKPAAPLASTDPPTEPLFCRKCGGHAGHYSDCPEVERALASTDPTPPDASPTPKFTVTSAEKARWRKFDSIALEVLCRVFDDGADQGFEEWRSWRDPGDWLSPQRALGAFIRRRLGAETAALRQDRDRLLRFAGEAIEAARIAEIGDWDGGDIQQVMEDCELIAPVEVTEPCDQDNCVCAECGLPATCYRVTELGQLALDAARLAGERHE